jgi:predicted nucleotidyltransferase/DNA-binding XRE family transcriptional regulator
VAARKSAGLTQHELGVRVGVAQQQIARWEASGYLTASLERVDLVARALGVRCRVSGTAAPRGPVHERTDEGDLLVAESVIPYKMRQTPGDDTAPHPDAVTPVRDVGQIAARIRPHGPELQERFGIEHVGVFGSFARGRQTDGSDVDLLVGMPRPGGFVFIEAAEYLEELLGREVDVMRPEGLSLRLRHRVMREEIRVWEA